MINLLPEKNKQALLMERNRKITYILCFLVVFFLLILTLLLFIIRIYLNEKIVSSEIFLTESQNQLSGSEIIEIQNRNEIANKSFSKLNIFYNRKVYFSEVVEKISNILPEDFYLTNLFIDLDVKETKKSNDDGSVRIDVDRNVLVTLSGFAPVRERLLDFKNNLEKEERFKDIVFPSSNLIKKENIDFYITFKIKI